MYTPSTLLLCYKKQLKENNGSKDNISAEFLPIEEARQSRRALRETWYKLLRTEIIQWHRHQVPAHADGTGDRTLESQAHKRSAISPVDAATKLLSTEAASEW